MLTAGEIADWVGAEVFTSLDSAAARSLRISGVAALLDAGPEEASVYIAKSYRADFEKSRAQVFLVSPEIFSQLKAENHPRLSTCTFLVSKNAYAAFAEWTKRLSPQASSVDHQGPNESQLPKRHPSSVIAADASVDPTASIGPNVVVGAGSRIEAGVVLYPGVYVGPACVVGEGTVLFPNVTLLEKVQIGKNCRIHSGAVLGADGFGYAPEFAGRVPVGHKKIYHLGSVVLGDEVEVGANSTIDRGTLGATIIGSKVKIDNQVQVGHNCSIGEGSILCGAVGVAGTSEIGRFVMIGAGSGISNNVKIGDYARIGALSGVARDVPSGTEYWGIPARPVQETMRILATQARMAKKKGDRS